MDEAMDERRPLRVDVHIHTAYSDGRSGVREVLRVAELRGLDAVAVTDHNTLRGYYEALRLRPRLMVIPGYEVRTDAGHILVLGLEELPRLGSSIVYEELIDWTRERGGLCVLAHPAAGRLRLNRWRRRRPDIVEALNASYPLRLFMRVGLKVAYELEIPAVAGSDAHRAWSVGDAYNLVDAGKPGVEGILEALRRGECRIGGGVSPPFTRLGAGLGYLVSTMRGEGSRGGVRVRASPQP
jgi:hypothetical protein